MNALIKTQQTQKENIVKNIISSNRNVLKRILQCELSNFQRNNLNASSKQQ